MVQFLSLALTAAALVSTASAKTYFHVNKGCVWSNTSFENNYGGQCAPKEASRPIIADGQIVIFACVKTEGGKDVSYCRYGHWTKIGNRSFPRTFEYKPVPTDWKDIFWGEDNCIYGPNRIKLGCAEHFKDGYQLPQKIYN